MVTSKRNGSVVSLLASMASDKNDTWEVELELSGPFISINFDPKSKKIVAVADMSSAQLAAFVDEMSEAVLRAKRELGGGIK